MSHTSRRHRKPIFGKRVDSPRKAARLTRGMANNSMSKLLAEQRKLAAKAAAAVESAGDDFTGSDTPEPAPSG